MDLLSESSLVIRLVVAAILGGIIGIEREIMNRTAGLRTHVMVSIGATLFTVLSIYFFDYDHGPRDPARIAAQIVSGIGFLGAGSIMKHGASVQGLTTAATLWVVAAIGMSCGCGAYIVASATCIISLLTLVVLRKLENSFADSNLTYLSVVIPNESGSIEKLRSELNGNGLKIRKLEITQGDVEMIINASVFVDKDITNEVLQARLTRLGATKINLEA